MTALLEFKQKLKNLYSRLEVYLMPVFKFILAYLYFFWINSNMGFMPQLNSIFLVLILALICCILPSGTTAFVGFVLMIGHAYALGIETGAFMLALIILIGVLFLRFSRGLYPVLICTPLSFAFGVPALLPIGAGLLGSAFAIFPATSGVIIYYFIRFLKDQSETLLNSDMEILPKLRFLADGLVQNQIMWMTVITFAVVILIVNLIRTRSFDHAWKIAIIAGGFAYVIMFVMEATYLNYTIRMDLLLTQAGISILVGLVLEFFFFGGDYSRTERLNYEDDEYYYYVKAVPKASVSTSRRSIKKITGQPSGASRVTSDPIVSYEPHPGQENLSGSHSQTSQAAAPVETVEEIEGIDFEKKLEESLKDL